MLTLKGLTVMGFIMGAKGLTGPILRGFPEGRSTVLVVAHWLMKHMPTTEHLPSPIGHSVVCAIGMKLPWE